MKVSAFMTTDVVYLKDHQTVQDAAMLMIQKNISVLPIVDSSLNLIGIITESDFLGKDANIPHALASIKKVLGHVFYDGGAEEIYSKVKSLPVSKIMTTKPHTISPENSLNDVVDLMNTKRLKKIPVVENNKLVGIVTRHDVVRAFTHIVPPHDNTELR